MATSDPSAALESPDSLLADRRGEMDLLIPEDLYLTSGVHIGTQQKSAACGSSSTRSATTGCTCST